MIANIHGCINGNQEKPNPPHIHALEQFGVGAHDQCKRFAMAEFIIAPALKPAKDGMKALVGMALELAKNGDVAGITNFF